MTPQQSALYCKCASALRTGFWWCIACQHIVDLENPGEPHQSCSECGSHRVVWKEPVLFGTKDDEQTP